MPRPTATHAKDIGPPPAYPNAIAIISTDFRYFGGASTNEWKEHAPHLTKMVEQLGQGDRVNHSRSPRRPVETPGTNL